MEVDGTFSIGILGKISGKKSDGSSGEFSAEIHEEISDFSIIKIFKKTLRNFEGIRRFKKSKSNHAAATEAFLKDFLENFLEKSLEQFLKKI